jgi:hypothetical protein
MSLCPDHRIDLGDSRPQRRIADGIVSDNSTRIGNQAQFLVVNPYAMCERGTRPEKTKIIQYLTMGHPYISRATSAPNWVSATCVCRYKEYRRLIWTAASNIPSGQRVGPEAASAIATRDLTLCLFAISVHKSWTSESEKGLPPVGAPISRPSSPTRSLSIHGDDRLTPVDS